jgi:ureidoglycolate lyase
MRLITHPLTAEAFAGFGDVLHVPATPGRTYFDGALSNLRPGAAPSLSIALAAPALELPLRSTILERHRFSSQSFVPVDAGRWLVMVAPKDAADGPDLAAARAFLLGPGQGVTYRADVWHHPLTVLDRAGAFAIFMWNDGGPDDTEFRTMPGFEIDLAEAG